MDALIDFIQSVFDFAIPILRGALLTVLLAPLGAALVCWMRGSANRNPRHFALWFAILHLLLTGVVVGLTAVMLGDRGDPVGFGFSPFRADPGFTPIAVPGDPGYEGDLNSQVHETTW